MKTSKRRQNDSVGIALIVFVLTFAGLGLAASSADAQPGVKVTFVEFGPQLDRGTKVVLNLTNASAQPFIYLRDTCIMMERGGFVSQSSTGRVVWIQPQVGPSFRTVLPPGQATNMSVFLPNDGRTGRVGVLLPKDRSEPEFHLVECNQQIQCSRVLPDGTIERARLIPAEGTKR
jgi:hypothetical protein